jgi:glycosyltransferase involved in cell wall biosynthesis
MKLLFFISSMWGGGAERVMSILCNELIKRDYDVNLATNINHTFAYKLDTGIKIIPLYPEDYWKKHKIIRLILYIKRIRSIVSQTKPDIIISFMHNICAITYGMRIPVIQSEHTTYSRKVSKKFNIGRLFINKLANKVTVLTQQDFDLLGNRLPNKVVMPNPLSFPIYTAENMRNNAILAAGRIDVWHVKGFDNLLKSWSLIAQKHKDWHIEIAGTGNDKNINYLKQLTKQLGIEDSVYFLGFVKDIDKLMQQSHIFVLSSRYEGFGMCLIEAMSQGCACISFDCPTGPKEIITDGYSGILIENQNIEKMSEAILRVIEDEELREMLSQNAGKEVIRFTPDKTVERWEELFKELKN